MLKLKTKRSAAKRFKVTGTGKVKHYKAYASHLLSGKTTKRKRNLRKAELVSEREVKNVKRLIPYL
jgi:large subunit ribosomal protein L35